MRCQQSNRHSLYRRMLDCSGGFAEAGWCFLEATWGMHVPSREDWERRELILTNCDPYRGLQVYAILKHLHMLEQCRVPGEPLMIDEISKLVTVACSQCCKLHASSVILISSFQLSGRCMQPHTAHESDTRCGICVNKRSLHASYQT